MKFYVAMDAVDGQTVHTFATRSPQEAVDFLKIYDHEGSSASIRVDSDASGEVGEILAAIANARFPEYARVDES